MERAKAIEIAATLVGDGQGNDLGVNTEYERGIAEFVCRYLGDGADAIPATLMAIHYQALHGWDGDCAGNA
jgi:hypothetical protein